MMGSLRAFSAQLPGDQAEAEATREAISYLSTPAPGKWIAGRVVTLLSHYFVAQQESSLAEAVAEDWCAILEEYPAWAIANAARWWMSRENPRRHHKPLPGDIQSRAHIEMERVRAARITVARGTATSLQPTPEPPRPPITDEDRARRAKVAAEILGRFRK